MNVSNVCFHMGWQSRCKTKLWKWWQSFMQHFRCSNTLKRMRKKVLFKSLWIIQCGTLREVMLNSDINLMNSVRNWIKGKLSKTWRLNIWLKLVYSKHMHRKNETITRATRQQKDWIIRSCLQWPAVRSVLSALVL